MNLLCAEPLFIQGHVPMMPNDNYTKALNTSSNKGKLLHLYLPPRVQMVKSLLQNAKEEQEEFITFSTPMVQSCNISPSKSCKMCTRVLVQQYNLRSADSYIDETSLHDLNNVDGRADEIVEPMVDRSGVTDESLDNEDESGAVECMHITTS
ncbi:hypothetical protein L2E82_17182 [Cichorium intybus]|uniref:Uncharacterized protein n=1 Tax=Cichorium intybus TaxID=13427 RepID=A0ACB9F8U9_CICIN|nr:hypothetical protein L2E82_17182 [Cichorium intybus]